MQRCVDESQIIVDDHYCDINDVHHRWYYGGSGGYGTGSAASGGSFSPHAGMTGVTSSSVSRGGFGSSGGHGSGGAGE